MDWYYNYSPELNFLESNNFLFPRVLTSDCGDLSSILYNKILHFVEVRPRKS